jgi:hypothetical protein
MESEGKCCFVSSLSLLFLIDILFAECICLVASQINFRSSVDSDYCIGCRIELIFWIDFQINLITQFFSILHYLG